MQAVWEIRVVPDAQRLPRIRERLSDPDSQGGNVAPSGVAWEVDWAKYRLCHLIGKYQWGRGSLQKDIARQIGVDEARISDILRGRVDGFTLDRMIGYAKTLHPGLLVRVIAAEQDPIAEATGSNAL